MATDNRTDAERRYDAERDGSLYFQAQPEPEPWAAIVDLLLDVAHRTDEDADEPEDTDAITAVLEAIAGAEEE